MRGKDYNAGLRGVLFEAQHYRRMSSAVWLYGWLVLRQTHQVGSLGFVLGGRPVSYSEIAEETGFSSRTLERWMRILRREGYIETQAFPTGMVVRITKAKKFSENRAAAKPHAGQGRPAQARRGGQAGPADPRGGAREAAEAATRICAGSSSKVEPFPRLPRGMNRGVLERQEEISGSEEPKGPSAQSLVRRAGVSREEWRWDWSYAKSLREENLRRELAVGAGPQVRRSDESGSGG